MKWNLLMWAFLALAVFAFVRNAPVEGYIALAAFWVILFANSQKKEESDEQE